MRFRIMTTIADLCGSGADTRKRALLLTSRDVLSLDAIGETDQSSQKEIRDMHDA